MEGTSDGSREHQPTWGLASPPMTDMMPLSEELSRVYARMSGLLLSEETVQTALDLVTSLALDTVGGAIGAGVTLIDAGGRRTSVAATSDLVVEIDELQYTLGEGPCLAVCAQGEPLMIDDLGHDERWPRWASAARTLGVRSTVSAPMTSLDRAFGAIKVYSDQPGVFTTTSALLLTRFAAQAAILLANVQSLDRAERLSESLQAALRARNLIATASGILMERYRLSEEQAFLRLVQDASRAQQELVDEATSVIRSPREPG